MHDGPWQLDGIAINDAVIARLAHVIDDESSIIVEHRHYYGARSPSRMVFDDADALREYLLEKAKAGDALYSWRFEECCTEERIIAHGKMPDDRGRIPSGGAY